MFGLMMTGAGPAWMHLQFQRSQPLQACPAGQLIVGQPVPLQYSSAFTLPELSGTQIFASSVLPVAAHT